MIYYDRLMRGLRQAVINALPASPTPTVVWSPSEYPRGSDTPFVALRMISGPDARDARLDSLGGTSLLPTTIRVTVTAVEGNLGYIGCAGSYWVLDVAGTAAGMDLETVEEYRDRWIAELATTGHSLDATITPVSTNAFDIVGTNLWSLYGFGARGECSHSVTGSTLAKVKTVDAIMRCEVQCFSSTRYPRGGAMETATRIMSAIELSPSYDVLDSHGLSVVGSLPIIDLTTLSGPGWESRAALTLDISSRTFIAEAIDIIETFTGSVTYNADGTTITQEL